MTSRPATMGRLADPDPSNAAYLSAKSPEWFTPAPIIEAARHLMGGIDLDPASCAQANETVKATRFYDEADNGLEQPWAGRAFLNPPGGRGLVRAFWERLVEYWIDDRVTQAIWIGYSLEQLQTLQACHRSPLDFQICFTSRRIAFVAPGGGKRSPTHSNYIVHLQGNGIGLHEFRDAFKQFGKVL